MRELELSYSTPITSVSADTPEVSNEPNWSNPIQATYQALVLFSKSILFLLLLGIASLGVLVLAVGVVNRVEKELESDSVDLT